MTWGQAFYVVISQSFIHGQSRKGVDRIRWRLLQTDLEKLP